MTSLNVSWDWFQAPTIQISMKKWDGWILLFFSIQLKFKLILLMLVC